MPADIPRQLIDILPPAPPPDATGPWLVAVLALAVTGALLLGLRHFTSRRGRARRRLARLQKRSRTLDAHTLAFRLAAILRDGLGLIRLQAAHADPACADGWRSFLARLDRARYAPESLPPDELQALLREARHWLGRWR